MTSTPDHEIAILGSGFAGLGMAIRLREAGQEDFVVLERASDVGGTWRDNTYPGCQCDIPSALYSFSFAPNPDWTRLFPLQEEIWAYLRDCADRFGVRSNIRFDTEVQGAAWDEEQGLWHVQTSRGELTARVLISGQGGLSEPSLPDMPGLGSFTGAMFHSARWDHDHDLKGKRVAVIGTGASAIQFLPEDPAAGRVADALPAHAALDHAPPRPADPAARAVARSSGCRSRRSSCVARSTRSSSRGSCRSPRSPT